MTCCSACRAPAGQLVRRLHSAPWCWVTVGSSLERRLLRRRVSQEDPPAIQERTWGRRSPRGVVVPLGLGKAVKVRLTEGKCQWCRKQKSPPVVVVEPEELELVLCGP